LFKVLWDDHEGNRHEDMFDTLQDAKCEAGRLSEEYDYVEIGGKTELLFNVCIQHIQTGDKMYLQVWAGSSLEATWGLWGLIGRDAQYRWIGTCPVCDESFNMITRDFPHPITAPDATVSSHEH